MLCDDDDNKDKDKDNNKDTKDKSSAEQARLADSGNRFDR